MKTLEQKIKVCSTCSNREFSKERGLICSLTKEKPEFEEDCERYEGDQQLIDYEKAQGKSEEGLQTMSGWLVIFLVFGVGISTIATIINALDTIINEDIGILYNILFCTYIACLVFIAGYTLSAFIRKKSNAVSLGKTYIGMVAFDTVLTLLIYTVIPADGLTISQALSPLLWSIIWFSYLSKSEVVDNRIPSETRTWGLLEKIIGGVYITCGMLMIIVFACIVLL